jgi:hypothetical protein
MLASRKESLEFDAGSVKSFCMSGAAPNNGLHWTQHWGNSIQFPVSSPDVLLRIISYCKWLLPCKTLCIILLLDCLTTLYQNTESPDSRPCFHPPVSSRHFSSIIPPRTSSPQCVSFTWDFGLEVYVHFSYPQVCYMPRPSHIPWSDQSNDIFEQ